MAISMNASLLTAARIETGQLSYLENLIDKKVTRVALTCFENIVHWVLMALSCLYPSYKKLYEEQCSRIILLTDSGNDVILQDCTAGKIVSTDLRPLNGEPSSYHAIKLKNREVLFLGVEGSVLLFGQPYNTYKMKIIDVPNQPGAVKIIELETSGTINEFIVDTNKEYIQTKDMVDPGFPQLQEAFAMILSIRPVVAETVYLTEKAITQIQDPHYLRPKEQE